MNSNDTAEGDLFYDDGESINTIESTSYGYARLRWSSQGRYLQINVVENNYASISSLTLDSLTIYELDTVPFALNINEQQRLVENASSRNIVNITSLRLAIDKSRTIAWTCKNLTINSTCHTQFNSSRNTASRLIHSVTVLLLFMSILFIFCFSPVPEMLFTF